jgi:peptide/nickel transport system substrate-binding protein
MLRSNGEFAPNGWSTSTPVEAEIAAWYAASSLDEEKAIARRLNKAALDHVVYAPLGMYLRHFAWRKSLAGVARAPLPLFWGVSKTA